MLRKKHLCTAFPPPSPTLFTMVACAHLCQVVNFPSELRTGRFVLYCSTYKVLVTYHYWPSTQ